MPEYQIMPVAADKEKDADIITWRNSIGRQYSSIVRNLIRTVLLHPTSTLNQVIIILLDLQRRKKIEFKTTLPELIEEIEKIIGEQK